MLGVADITAANMNENVALEYWLSNVPVRLTFLFGLTGYVYLFKQDGIFGSGSAATIGIGEPLQNSLVFSFGFFEIAMWFWVCTICMRFHFLTLRAHCSPDLYEPARGEGSSRAEARGGAQGARE